MRSLLRKHEPVRKRPIFRFSAIRSCACRVLAYTDSGAAKFSPNSKMKLSIVALAVAAAILNALRFLFVSLVNLILPGYGGRYLAIMTSLYPGYDPTAAPIAVVLGTLYALLGGAASGALLAWLYNRIAK